MTPTATVPGSFRDPSGFMFTRDGELYRQVNSEYRDAYHLCRQSGLYDRLMAEQLLIPHIETAVAPAAPDALCILKPERLPFISYPYEWCFSQLKAAALLTLQVQSLALDHGLSLKDASAYNVQFRGGRPIFIDTLSFEPHRPGAPWVAYRQFCMHFLAPLALMAHRDARLGGLLCRHLDGIPLELASALLPWRTKLSPALGIHLHLQAAFERKARKPAGGHGAGQMSEAALRGMLHGLEAAVRGLTWEPTGRWDTYYAESLPYPQEAFAAKERLVAEMIARCEPDRVWDLGANTGAFSRLAAAQGAFTVAFDYDHASVERHYRQCVRDGEERILPLVLDLTNPSPGIGWLSRERSSLLDRGPADLALALALMHHLVVGNNLPLPALTELFAAVSRQLIIEFVPFADPRVRLLLANRRDVHAEYTQQAFEESFGAHFRILAREPIPGSCRVLYIMQNRF